MWGERHAAESLWKNTLGYFFVKYKGYTEVSRLRGVTKVADSSVDQHFKEEKFCQKQSEKETKKPWL